MIPRLTSMLEHLNSLPLLVLVAYALCICALLLFALRQTRERKKLRRALNKVERD